MTVQAEFAFLCHFYFLPLLQAQMPEKYGCFKVVDNSKRYWCNFQPTKYKIRIGGHNMVLDI